MTRTPISPKDIRVNDTVERDWLGTTLKITVARIDGRLAYTEEKYCAALSDNDNERWFLINRPAAIIHPKGATLWRNSGHLAKDPLMVAEDFREGDNLVRVVHAVHGQIAYRPEDLTTTPPAVEIPGVPTLGTVIWKYDDSKVSQSETALWSVTSDGLCVRSESTSIPVKLVLTFTPIRTLADDETAVKTAAVEGLRDAEREAYTSIGSSSERNHMRKDAIQSFLATIDSAGESS